MARCLSAKLTYNFTTYLQGTGTSNWHHLISNNKNSTFTKQQPLPVNSTTRRHMIPVYYANSKPSFPTGCPSLLQYQFFSDMAQTKVLCNRCHFSVFFLRKQEDPICSPFTVQTTNSPHINNPPTSIPYHS